MKILSTLAISMLLICGMAIADTPKDTPKDADAVPAKSPAKPKSAPKKAEKSDAALAAEIEELRQMMQSQQEQLQMLKEELAKRDRQIDEAREAAAGANARATEATAKAADAVNAATEMKTSEAALDTSVNALKAENATLKTTVAETAAAAKQNGSSEEPASIRFKGITLTPGGFLAAESVFRTRSAQADINTPFTGTPFPDNALSKVSEFNASGRQSRITLLGEGTIGAAKISGYYEADFLSAGATSNSRQSNSYTMRQRQLFGQAALDSGWTFTGGQMWSLVTETKKALDNRTENLPMTIDPQYSVGFSWARQFAFRVTKSLDDQKVTLGFAVEEPQATFGGRGSPTAFFVGAPGAGGGLLNFVDTTGYSANRTPDFIVKAAVDPGWGHYEIFGILSTFRSRVYPCSAPTLGIPATCVGAVGGTAANAFNDTRTGGGAGVNLRVPVVAKKLDAGLHLLGGDGIGRYSSAQLADVTARPDGTLAPIRGGSVLGTLEFHVTPKIDVYANYGVEYAARTAYTFTNLTTLATVPVGYGSPLFSTFGCEGPEAISTGAFASGTGGSCSVDLRNVQEATLGFWHRIYQGPKGGIRWGIQYSYLSKASWSGNNNTPTAPGVNAKAVDNMVFTSFRYYIP